MTSELRPAVEVWRQIYKAWVDADPSFNDALNQHNDDLLAASMIEADREAVRAEQAAEIERLREALTKLVNSTGCCDACECWRKLRAQASAALGDTK